MLKFITGVFIGVILHAPMLAIGEKITEEIYDYLDIEQKIEYVGKNK